MLDTLMAGPNVNKRIDLNVEEVVIHLARRVEPRLISLSLNLVNERGVFVMARVIAADVCVLADHIGAAEDVRIENDGWRRDTSLADLRQILLLHPLRRLYVLSESSVSLRLRSVDLQVLVAALFCL